MRYDTAIPELQFHACLNGMALGQWKAGTQKGSEQDLELPRRVANSMRHWFNASIPLWCLVVLMDSCNITALAPNL